MSENTITIKKIRDDLYIVERKLANGIVNFQQCDNETEARIYCRGLSDGFSDARQALSTIHYRSTIEEVKS